MAGLSVQNLGEMRTKVKAWADRTDLADTLYDDFINIAVDKANRVLRLEERTLKSTRVVTDGAFSLPDDYIETHNVFVETSDKKWALTRKSTAIVEAYQNQTGPWYNYEFASYPVYFARDNERILIAPANTAIEQVELVYWAETTTLTVDGNTNWLITDEPTSILYGALSEVGKYIMDEEMEMKWQAAFEKELAEVQDRSDREKWSGNTIAVTP